MWYCRLYHIFQDIVKALFISHAIFLFCKHYSLFKVQYRNFSGLILRDSERSSRKIHTAHMFKSISYKIASCPLHMDGILRLCQFHASKESSHKYYRYYERNSCHYRACPQNIFQSKCLPYDKEKQDIYRSLMHK